MSPWVGTLRRPFDLEAGKHEAFYGASWSLNVKVLDFVQSGGL